MFGCNLSIMTGKEREFTPSYDISIPEAFTYEPYIGKVKDQGDSFMCVPYAISTLIEFYWEMNGQKHRDFDIKTLYNTRALKAQEGMSLKEALMSLKILGYRMEGIPYSPIGDFVTIGSSLALKAFMTFNPVLLTLPVYDEYWEEFWEPRREVKAYHAVLAIGYSPEGIRIQNSWGTSYGDGGRSTIPWADFIHLKEAWGILF